VDEATLQLERALDAAVVGSLSEIKIVHGFGTGAVRARTYEVLGADRRVESFRVGVHGEGGAGVIIAMLR
jgi:DNA mismatch repair protein MutS2